MRIDLKKDRREFYAPPRSDFTEVTLPPLRYLAIDGRGDPNTGPEYTVAVPALYAVGYAVRAAFKARTGDDFVVGPLEGLWSSADPTAFVQRRRGDWEWTMLLPLLDQVSDVDVSAGRSAAAVKKPELPVAGVSLIELDEGRCLQIMHVGSYDDEGPTLARLHEQVMPARGLSWNGRAS